jgi:hypothetical protein
MLLKYRIIFYAIILCLFGLTLMTVSPVFAQQGSGDSIFLNSGKTGRENNFAHHSNRALIHK